MPRPALPPTPMSSTDILGKDDMPDPSNDQAFTLPSPALPPNHSSPSSSSSQTVSRCAPGSADALPPPPTRSRTIIEVNPKVSSQPRTDIPPRKSTRRTNKHSKSISGAIAGPKPSASAGGQKIARKTAHSVIERRRRNKMNEEFSTLKAMIPACSGQEMHKLAILQASIEYLLYLESCIRTLKSTKQAQSSLVARPETPVSCLEKERFAQKGYRTVITRNGVEFQGPDEYETTTGTTLLHKETRRSDLEQSSVQPDLNLSGKVAISNLSPSRERLFMSQHSQPEGGASEPISPQKRSTGQSLLMPTTEQDQAATAALLLLGNDRRHLGSKKARKGLSVVDLLAS